MATITGGQAAGFATIELMRRTRGRIDPFAIVTQYATSHFTALLWAAFGAETVKCIVDRCRTLAMLWESAWIEGTGIAMSAASLGTIGESTLATIYNASSPEFLPSTLLNDISGVI